MEIIPCDYCGSSDRDTLYDISDWPWLDQTLGIALVVCKNCGLLYLCPRPDKNEMQKFYPDDYPSYSKLLEDEKAAIVRWARRRNLSIRRKYIEKFTDRKSGKILDVGCSTGLFLDEMRSSGWEVIGIEPNPSAAKIAQDRLRLNVHKGYLETFKLPSEKLDVITYWDVLEHTYSPRHELEIAVELLETNGLLVINIPNWNAFDRKIFGPAWQGFDPPRHLFVFPYEIISGYLAGVGCEIISRKCVISSYYSYLMGLEKKLTIKNPKISTILMSILRFPGIRFIFEPLLFIIQSILQGSVITIVARKTRKMDD